MTEGCDFRPKGWGVSWSLLTHLPSRSGAEAAGLEVESREFVPGVPFSDKKDKDGSTPPDALGL